MITLSTAATSLLSRSFTYVARYSSYLGDSLLAASIPVEGGAETADRGLATAERITLTVPIRDGETLWSPTTDRHPLAANGQRIRVELGIDTGDLIEWFQRGEYVIVTSEAAGETVTVTAAGLLYLVEEARLVTPYQPTGTFKSAIRGLVEPAVPVVYDPLLVDRAVPGGINFDEDRLDGLGELCDAWPADYIMSSEGYLYIYSTTAPRTPVTTISASSGGTIIEVAGSSTREGAYNVVVARSSTVTTSLVQGVQYDTSGGPKSYGGAFNPLPVPYFFESPLITTVAQAKASALTILRRLQRNTSREFEVELVTDPRLQVGDLVTLQCPAYTGLAEIDRLQLDYGTEAAMRLNLRTVTS